MSSIQKNPLRQAIEGVARRLNVTVGTVCVGAFNNSRKHDRLTARDRADASDMQKLEAYETAEQERRACRRKKASAE